MTELSDALLVAYVDGQLARNKNEAIGRVLESDGVAAQRAKALGDAKRKLECAFDAMLLNEWAEIEARPDDRASLDYEALTRKYARWSRRRLIAVSLLVFAAGAATGYAVGRAQLQQDEPALTAGAAVSPDEAAK